MSEARMLKVRLRDLGTAEQQQCDATQRVTERRALLCQSLRRARVERGISLRAMARRIGCSAAMLSDIELGRRWSDTYVTTYALELTEAP